MLARIIGFSIRQRWLVLALVALLAALGIWSATRLPIDAVPDITNVQVQINTEAEGYSPLEAEQRVTFPVETAIAGIPNLDYTRSVSRYGLSQVTVVFKDGTDIYFARQLVNERIQAVKSQLPPGIEPTMGPIATGLGEIFMYSVEPKPGAKKPDGSEWTPTDLRTLNDDVTDGVYTAYVIFSEQSNKAIRYYGDFRPDAVGLVQDAIRRSPRWTLVHEDGETAVFRSVNEYWAPHNHGGER